MPLRSNNLSPDEESIMRQTFKAAFLRAADIIERITQLDLLNAQEVLLASGSSLEQVARVDRAHLAIAHLRASAQEISENEEKPKV